MKKVVILGAGITGLTAGLELLRAGVDVEIHEAARFPGGLAASESIDGMPFDYGPHIFHTCHDDIARWWRDEFGDLLTEKPFFYKNYRDGELYDYPLSREGIERFPEPIRTRVLKEIDAVDPADLKRARNFREYVTALVGPTLQQTFFESYSEKLWGIPTDRMSVNWAPKRIELRENHRGFWHGQFSATGTYGAGRIPARMARTFEREGGKLFLGHRIDRLEHRDACIERMSLSDGSVLDVREATVVSTIPLSSLCTTLDVTCGLRFNSILLAFLVFDQAEVLPEQTHSVYFADRELDFHRVSEQKRYSDVGYPADKTLLCFEISYTLRKHLAEMDDEELAARLARQLGTTGWVDPTRLIKATTRKLPHVNPILELGYENELARVQTEVGRFRNLHTVGGAAEYQYGDMQTMIAKARDIAELLTSKHYTLNNNLKRGSAHRFETEVEICHRTAGPGQQTIVIAEIGLNHNGDLEMASQLIQEAKRAGADIVKLQTFTADRRVSATAKGARYADPTLKMEETTHEMFKRLELSLDDHRRLFAEARGLGLSILSTPFDERSVDLLLELGVDAFKIASFDLVNLPFLRYVAAQQRPMILATGMGNLGEIEEALDAIAAEGNRRVVLLHCVSSYPARVEDINLGVLHTLREAFKVPVGFSDHTIGDLAATMAITLGADVVERHFTLGKDLEGPDHVLSSDPPELTRIMLHRDLIFAALGTGVKKPRPTEFDTINRQRKSIFVSTPLRAGDRLRLSNLAIRGPGHGLLPRYLNLVLDRRVTRDLRADSPLTWDDVLAS